MIRLHRSGHKQVLFTSVFTRQTSTLSSSDSQRIRFAVMFLNQNTEPVITGLSLTFLRCSSNFTHHSKNKRQITQRSRGELNWDAIHCRALNNAKFNGHITMSYRRIWGKSAWIHTSSYLWTPALALTPRRRSRWRGTRKVCPSWRCRFSEARTARGPNSVQVRLLRKALGRFQALVELFLRLSRRRAACVCVCGGRQCEL